MDRGTALALAASLSFGCAAAGQSPGGQRDGGGGGGGSCEAGEFECDNGFCIPRAQVCNGTEQCVDGSDEATCAQDCTASEFECRDGTCVPMTALCNDIAECPTGDDEASCGGGTGGGSCATDQFACPGGTCIAMTQRCDGRMHCPGGEDEAGCPPPTCGADQFRCQADSSCIPRASVCDGTPQCPGGSDEQGCTGGGGGTTNNCGSVTFAGECVSGGSAVRWCENNAIQTLTCSSGYSCRYDSANGIYDCEPDGTGGGGGGTTTGSCGSVTWQGGCDGDWVYWCEGTGSAAHIEEVDCFPDTCGWTGSYYGCVPYANSCIYAYDGECDEPTYCTYGTDSFDCGF